MEGLPTDDAATWRQDQPGWDRRDEWAARMVEAIEHWGAVFTLALTGAKGSALPSPQRLFDHPDRPDPEGKPKPKRTGKKRLATPADVARTLAGGGTDA